MYRHLEDHAIIIPSKLKKIVILIGWLADPLEDDSDEFISSEDTLRMKACDETSDKVDTDLCRAILSVEGDYFQAEIDPLTRKPKTYIRASKSSQRSSFICQAEASVNGICDTVLFASRVWPAGDKDWIDKVNKELLTINPNIKVLHRYVMPPGTHDFHAERDCTQRRYEYILPINVLTNEDIYKKYIPAEPVKERRLKWLEDMSNDDIIRVKNSSVGVRFPANTEMGQVMIVYFRKMKRLLKKFNGYLTMHNFTTGGGCPEESTSQRRVDRIFHKDVQSICGKDYLVLSISGDLFMRGQIRHMIGLLIAILSFWLPEDYLDAALDKNNIAEIPPFPGCAVALSETRFCYFEGNKHFLKLDPRREKDGDPKVINDWEKVVSEHISKKWDQLDLNKWLNEFKNKCIKLNDRLMKVKLYQARTNDMLQISLKTIDTNIPDVYRKVLELLREADSSGLWPTTTVARQKVIDSTTLAENDGKGGSFTLGCLPKNLLQPRSNSIFPDLLRECFILERRLFPNRPPSSTIAVNKHCQFRPHRDIGLGNGQSDSLIFALGDFTGGELLVENEIQDIRYKPLEFNGWQSRHSTLPFIGERYSLVFFTPRGIDLEDMFWLKDIECNNLL